MVSGVQVYKNEAALGPHKETAHYKVPPPHSVVRARCLRLYRCVSKLVMMPALSHTRLGWPDFVVQNPTAPFSVNVAGLG